MSISKCFNGASNKKLKALFQSRLAEGNSEETAALLAIKEYSLNIQERLSKLKGGDVGEILDIGVSIDTKVTKATKTVSTKKVRIKKTKVKVDNPKGARNTVLDLFMSVLKDAKYYNEMMTSIDNDTFKEGTLSFVEKTKEEDMDLWDPIKAIDTRFSYRTGGTGVAVSANSLSDHILTQNKMVKFEFNQGTMGNYLADMQYSEALGPETIKDLAAVINKRRILDGKKPMTDAEATTKLTKVRISGTLSELTNAFVDIANEDAFVTRGNWGTITNGYGMMLIRQGIHPHVVSAILRQPAMVELVDEITNKEGLIDNTASYKIEEDVLAKWIKKAEAAGITIDQNDQYLGRLTGLVLKDLFLNTTTAATSRAALLNQVRVLRNFIEAKPTVKKYNSYVSASKNDARGAGKNVKDMFIRNNKLSDSYYYTEVGNLEVPYGIKNAYEKYMYWNGETTLSYTMFMNTVKVMERMINDNPLIFGGINNDTFEYLNRAAAQNTADNRVLSTTQADFLLDSFTAYRMSGFQPLVVKDTEAEISRFVGEIFDLKTARKYSILDKLLVSQDELTNQYSFMMELTSQKSPESKNEMTNSWRLLLKERPHLGDFLVRQAYRESGFMPSPRQFHELIPFEWFLENNYMKYIRNLEAVPDDAFLEQAVRSSDATEFFKFIKGSVHEEFMVQNINSDNNRMGVFAKYKDHVVYRAPKFGITADNQPVKAVGLIKIVTVKGDERTVKTNIIYEKIDKATSKSIYDLNNPSVSNKDFRAFAQNLMKDAVEGGAQVTILDINDVKANGSSFFRSAGPIVDLEAEQIMREDQANNKPGEQQMCQ